LADAELLFCSCAAGEAGGQFGFGEWLGGDEVDARVKCVGLESVFLKGEFFV
jgi:hypothetical protein